MKTDLPALTAVRYLAAIGVVLHHYGQQIGAPTWLHNTFVNGYLGVPFFFMLSGFILVYSSHGRTMNTRDFLVRRVARIYPVYVFAWVLAGVAKIAADMDPVYVAKSGATLGGASLLLLQAWIPGVAKHWNWPGWSLSCEAFFYLMFPLVYAYLSRLSTRMLAILAAVLTALAAVKACLVQLYAKTTILKGSPLQTSLGEYLDQLPPLAIVVFLLGAVIGHLYVRGVRVHSGFAWPTSGAIAGFLMMDGAVLELPLAAWLTPMFGLLILALANMPYRLPAFTILLGQASYAMYIIQFPLHHLLYPTGPKAPTSLYLAGFIVFLTLCSIATYLYIERPMERWIKRRAARSAMAAVQTA